MSKHIIGAHLIDNDGNQKNIELDIHMTKKSSIYNRYIRILTKSKEVYLIIKSQGGELKMNTGKMNLASFVHVEMEVKGQSGMVKGMFIPYEKNHVFVSEAGSRNIDFIFFKR